MRPSLRQVLFRSAGLDLNFAGGVFSLNNTRTDSPANIPGWSFSRTDTNGTATALDLAGNVIQFATGVPRITNRGILVEEARTNLLLRSTEFDNAAWTKNACTVTADQAIAPDGSLTADLVTDNSTSGTSLEQTVTVSSGAICTASRFIKYDDVPWIRFVIGDGVNFIRVWFNVQTGTVGTTVVAGAGGNASATITPAANGFYRCTVTGSLTGVTSYPFFTTTATADASVTRVSGGKRLEWGAQLELGAFATSPIITTGAAGTRGADVAIVTGLVLPSEYSLSAVAVPNIIAGADRTLASLTTGSTANRTPLFIRASDSLIMLQVDVASANQFYNGAGTATVNTLTRAAARLKAGDTAATGNGATPATNTGTIPNPTRLCVGSDGSGTSALLNGYVDRIRVLPFAATNTQLQALTAP